jgi:hypothetical protein
VNETVVKVADDSYPPAASDFDANSAAQCNKVNCVVKDAIKTGDSTHHKTSPNGCNGNNDDVIVKLAELHYLKVDVFGADHCWKALLDGGSEVDVINRAKLIQLSVPYDVVGEVALRPMAGPSIPAQLVRLQVRISPDSEYTNSTEYISIVAAACDDLHDELILSEPTVQRLIDSCHRQAELVEGDTHDSRVAEVSAVTRSMSSATVDSTGN